jgi:hypothetical protein
MIQPLVAELPSNQSKQGENRKMNKPVAKKATAKKAAPAKKKAAPAKKAAAPKKVAPAVTRPAEPAKAVLAAPAPAQKTSAPAKKSLWKRIFGGK